jgi:hypothetical protein
MCYGIVLVLGLTAFGDGEPAARYGIAADLRVFPQTTAKETLESVLKAIEAKRFDYLVAQLADPEFVDERVKRLFAGKFEPQVEDTRTRLDAPAVELLKRFLKDGDWTEDKMRVTARLKDVPDQCLCLRQLNGRWFLENRSKP